MISWSRSLSSHWLTFGLDVRSDTVDRRTECAHTAHVTSFTNPYTAEATTQRVWEATSLRLSTSTHWKKNPQTVSLFLNFHTTEILYIKWLKVSARLQETAVCMIRSFRTRMSCSSGRARLTARRERARRRGTLRDVRSHPKR